MPLSRSDLRVAIAAAKKFPVGHGRQWLILAALDDAESAVAREGDLAAVALWREYGRKRCKL